MASKVSNATVKIHESAPQGRLRDIPTRLDRTFAALALGPQAARHRALLAHNERRADALALLESTHHDAPGDPQVAMALSEALLQGREPEGATLLEDNRALANGVRRPLLSGACLKRNTKGPTR